MQFSSGENLGIKKNNRGKTAQSVIEIIGTKIAGKPLNLIVSIVVANYLGPSEKGLAAWVVVIVNVASFFFSFGCGSAIRFIVGGGSGVLNAVAWTSIVIGVANGLIGSITLTTLIHYDMLGKLTGELSVATRWLIILILPCLVVEINLNRALIGEHCYRFINLIELGGLISYSLLLFIFVILLEGGSKGANIAFFISKALTFVLTVSYVFRAYRPRINLDWRVVVQSYNYGLRTWIGGMFSFVGIYLDSLLVGWVLPSASLGNYSVAIALSRSLSALPLAINTVFTNRMIGMEKRQALRETALLHRITFWIMIICSLILSIFGYFLLPYFVPKFKEIPDVLSVLLVGTICAGSTTIFNSYFASQGMPGRSSMSQLFGVLIGAAVTPLFVSKWAGLGGALSSSLMNLAILGFMWFLFWQKSSIDAIGAFALRRGDWLWVFKQIRAVSDRMKDRLIKI